MHRSYHRWWSPSLRRPMELLIFGHAGARVLVFPTSMGKFYEWEDRGMTDAVGDWIARGWVQLVCVDSVDAESWYNYGAHPGARAWRQVEYEQYLLREVLPLSYSLNPNPYLIATGASFGAFHAMNFGLRNPGTVNRVLAMSGLYDIRRWVRGYHDDNVYFNNPVSYLAGAHEPRHLAALRALDLTIAVGHDDPNVGSSHQLSDLLWQKGIWHALRLWDGWAHDWPWWHQMLRLYLRGAG